MRSRFPVPPGWAVPAEALAQALAAAELDPLADDVEALRNAILDLPLPEDWRRAWVDAARALGPRLAVRSSGVAEDGAARSFAGQHATVLDVTPEEVPEAIRRVWASQWSDAAVSYGTARPRGDQMAVLVQRMIAPRVSGVLFTTNPLNGSWREMVVEAVWGLGEALVSGRVVPHGYLVRRPRLTPRGLLSLRSRTRLEVMEEDLPPQPQWLPPGAHDLQPTPSELRHARTLEPRTLRALCRLGLRVERDAGTPQDVEWALDDDGHLHLLQARPITASATPRPRGDVLWTRRFVGERWSDAASPLGWSIVAPVLSWFIAYPHTQEQLLGGGPPLRLVQGRPYVNATVFRHLLFKLPGAPPPRFMLELLPPSEALQ